MLGLPSSGSHWHVLPYLQRGSQTAASQHMLIKDSPTQALGHSPEKGVLWMAGSEGQVEVGAWG